LFDPAIYRTSLATLRFASLLDGEKNFSPPAKSVSL
jgi:hypothetical protein